MRTLSLPLPGQVTGISLRPYLRVRVNKESLFEAVGSKERTVTVHPRWCGAESIISFFRPGRKRNRSHKVRQERAGIFACGE